MYANFVHKNKNILERHEETVETKHTMKFSATEKS